MNLYTKQSQWEKPTEPAYPSSGGAPPGAPPGYDSNRTQYTGPEKGNYASNNPYGSSGINSGAGSAHNINDDEALARKLQAEEEARAHQSGQTGARTGASDNYYSSSTPQPQSQPQYSNELPPREQDRGKSKGGFLGKLLGKASSSSSRPNQGYGQQGYPQGGMGMGGGGYGMPQQHYGGYPQQGYGGYPPQQQYYGQPQRKTGGGLGGGAGMALGAGAGLLGGAMLMNGIDNAEDHAYEQGYDQGVSLSFPISRYFKLTYYLSMTTAMMAAAVTTLVVVTIWAAVTSSPARSSLIAPSLIGLHQELLTRTTFTIRSLNWRVLCYMVSLIMPFLPLLLHSKY